MLKFTLLVSMLPSLALATPSKFPVKIYQNEERTTAVITYGRANGIHAFCQRNLFLGSNAGSHVSLLRCSGFEASTNPEWDGMTVTFTSVEVRGQSQQGVVTYSGPAGYTEHPVICENDSRGFVACSIQTLARGSL